MRASIIIPLLFLVPFAATAQQEERLPDLTPQEFEIRGDLQISLPDLERQPLRGFAPPPRTYVVPADRQPFVAPYAQRLDRLPHDPLPAASPPALTGTIPRIGQVDLMAGRYLGRRGRITVNAGGFSLDGLYHGFSDFTLPRQTTATTDADNLTGRVGFTGGDQVLYQIGVDGAYHQFGIHNAYLQLSDLDAPLGPTVRQFTNIGVEASVSGTAPMVPFRFRTRFDSADLDDPGSIEFFNHRPDLVPTTLESRLAFDGSVQVGPVQADGLLGLASRDGEGLGESLLDYDTGLSGVMQFGTTSIRAGVQLFGFSASPAHGGRSMMRVGPVVEIDAPIGGGARVYAWNRAGTETHSLHHVLRNNPYLDPSADLHPDLHLVNAEAGFEIQSAPVLIGVFGGARLSPNLLYFERPIDAGTGDPTHGLFLTRYDQASLYRGGANITVYGPADLSLSAGAEYRHARLTEQGRDVPYVAPFAWRVSLAIPFDNGRGLLQSALHGEGVRPTEDPGETAPAWGDLTVELHYRLAGRFGLIARGERLGFRAEEWPGFPQPGTMILAGLRAGW